MSNLKEDLEKIEITVDIQEYKLETLKLSFGQTLRWCNIMYSNLIFSIPIVKAYWFDTDKNMAGITIITVKHDTEILMLDVLFTGSLVTIWIQGKDNEYQEYECRFLNENDFDILYKPLIIEK